MGKRPRADSIGEASSTPKGAAGGGPGSAPSSSFCFSVVPVEVIARMLEYLMETPALLPKRLVSKKWDQAMLCLLENTLCQRLTGSGEWKIVEPTPMTKLMCKALSRMTIEVASSIKVLDLSKLALRRGETCDELLECFRIPFAATKSRNSATGQGASPPVKLSLVLGEVPFQPPKLLRILKTIGSNLVGLSLNCEWTSLTDEEFVKEIAHLDGLEELALVSCKGITAASVKEIAKLPRLRSLDLSYPLSLTNDSRRKPGRVPFQALTRILTLEKLILGDVCATADAQVVPLAGALVMLKVLDLSWTRITDKSCEAIAKLSNLETLNIDDCSALTDASLKALSAVASLTELDVAFIKATEEGIKHLAKLTNLKILGVSCCDSVTDRVIEVLSTLRNLESLHAANTEMGDAGLRSLTQSSPKLSELQLTGCQRISDVGVAALSKLQHLKTLELERNTSITSACMKHLSTIPSLTKLCLNECTGITDAGIAALAGSATLEVLELNECNVSNVSPLGKLSTLKDLSLVDTKIRDDSLRALARLPNIEALELADCSSITDLGISEILKMGKLTHLDLSGLHRLTNDSVTKLTALSQLEFLSIGRCSRLSEPVILHLMSLPSMRHISVEELPVTDTIALELAKMRTLKTIDLSGCEGVSERARKILKKQKMEIIDVWNE